MVAVASTPSRRQRDDWLLVLQSAGIGASAVRSGREWTIIVADSLELAARANLAEFERENARLAEGDAAPLDLGPSVLGSVVGVCLVALHALSFLAPGREWWLRAGRASSWRILDGELWRAVTALTLHADAVHVAGNALASAVFVSAVGRIYGAGVGLLAVVAGGVLGNLMNALYRGGVHLSIGASTSVFAAVGILAGAQMLRRRRMAQDWRRSWLPLGAAVAILAMLGVGVESDVAAHVFGIVAGVGVGLGVSASSTGATSPRLQVLAGAAALAIVVGAWAIAIAGAA